MCGVPAVMRVFGRRDRTGIGGGTQEATGRDAAGDGRFDEAHRGSRAEEGRGRTCDFGRAVREGDPGESLHLESVHRHGHRHDLRESRRHRRRVPAAIGGTGTVGGDRSVCKGLRVHHRYGRWRRDRRSGGADDGAAGQRDRGALFCGLRPSHAVSPARASFRQHAPVHGTTGGRRVVGHGHPVALPLPDPFLPLLDRWRVQRDRTLPRAQR